MPWSACQRPELTIMSKELKSFCCSSARWDIHTNLSFRLVFDDGVGVSFRPQRENLQRKTDGNFPKYLQNPVLC